MRYISTRGKSPEVTFKEVLLSGLAPDGGLYLPTSWPQFSVDQLKGILGDDHSYKDLATEIIWPFVESSMEKHDLGRLVERAYDSFSADNIVPLKHIHSKLWIAELFHGPTLAFKDIALQLVGELFEFQLQNDSEKITIVGATSGDTGSAAIEACRDREAMEIFILHPYGRTSEVQRRQMTSVRSANVFNIAIEGTFDDCQDLVKAMFADVKFSNRINMSAVNSINWARVMAQIVYYWWASMQVTDSGPVNFCVPSGNFGNIFAGHSAHKMGLPVDKFIVASNTNDVLDRFFRSGEMELRDVKPTFSPSMDIQISSNFERLLFEVYGRNGSLVEKAFRELRTDLSLSVGEENLLEIQGKWLSRKVNDQETLETISKIADEFDYLIDPHTAVGLKTAESYMSELDAPIISLATAHPSKFPNAVEHASGITPSLPQQLSDLFEREESYEILPNDEQVVKAYILEHSRR
ncbi:MAG: threonine synthase [Acidimicrobiaceae bacterium]|jgi:threonine synthase|nr:threonine synthase [Acidimicrobiaceae bacterium]|tara:strand:+ start:10770 stop:12167 length:1398 start_codon:yes stop_codon:yes gene_type:complete